MVCLKSADRFTQPLPVWRHQRWQLWREEYLERSDPDNRGAWIQAQESIFSREEARSRLASVRDVYLGGLSLQVSYRFETGTLLQVEVWGEEARVPEPMQVRVLRVAAQPNGQWLLGCTFIR